MLHLLTQKCKGWVHKILTNMNEITNNFNLLREQNQYNPIYKKKNQTNHNKPWQNDRWTNELHKLQQDKYNNYKKQTHFPLINEWQKQNKLYYTDLKTFQFPLPSKKKLKIKAPKQSN